MVEAHSIENTTLGYSLYRVYINLDNDEVWYLDDTKNNLRVVIHVNRVTGKLYITFLKDANKHFRNNVLKKGVKDIVSMLVQDKVVPQVKLTYSKNTPLYLFFKSIGFKKSNVKGVLSYPID